MVPTSYANRAHAASSYGLPKSSPASSGTASDSIFMTLEKETFNINVVVRTDVQKPYHDDLGDAGGQPERGPCAGWDSTAFEAPLRDFR